MVFIGFAVNYMVRINMNIALVAMVEPPRRFVDSAASAASALEENGTRLAAAAAAAGGPAGTRCIAPAAERTAAINAEDDDDKAVSNACNARHRGKSFKTGEECLCQEILRAGLIARDRKLGR